MQLKLSLKEVSVVPMSKTFLKAVFERLKAPQLCRLTCPYHGWSYALDGRLKRASKLKGIKDFKASNFGLKPIQVCEKKGFIFINFSANADPRIIDERFKGVFESLEELGSYGQLSFVKRVDYKVKCNWKVFVDNYLDGGYHVPVLHKDLTTNIDLRSYKTDVKDFFSIQTVAGNAKDDRIGKAALFAYLYPNFMINRYGPWMDTNLVLPTGTLKSR